MVASAVGGEPSTGWRGNGTGLWPDSKAPWTWHRLAHGALEGLRGQANQPRGSEAGDAPLVPKGLVREWLVVRGLTVKDSIQNLDDDLLSGESRVEPNGGDGTSSLVWEKLVAPHDDPMVFGTAVLPFVELGKPETFKPNQVAYAHTHVYSPRGGPIRGVVDHCFGLKVWVNGREVYRCPERLVALGGYAAISRHELAHTEPPSGRFDCDLKPGWNRLLVKLTSSNREGHKEMSFCLRLMDPPTVNYESQNIRWMTELPGRSTSTPILVGDRVFLAAEPDLLVCVDKNSGKLLWSAANNYYECLTHEEKQANPAFASRVDPLVAALRIEPDRSRRLELRRKIQQTLGEIDSPRFEPPYDGHFASHFGIVGFSMPTSVTDGKRVYVWSGLGVAACYDLDGNRQWITRAPTDELKYGSSPALADGVLAVFLGKLYGLEAETGKLKWTQHRVHENIAAVLAAKLADQPVFITQRGEIIRPSDGKLLFRPQNPIDGGCWGPPVVLGNTVYVGKYGVLQLGVFDFSNAAGDPWHPELKATIEVDVPREHHLRRDGSWLDRSTAGSPLVHEGLAYMVDIYGCLYVVELESRKTLYFKDLELDGLMHYNAVPVAASVTLVGRHVIVLDNQGTAVVFKPGREFQIVARNRIETQLDRAWPIPAQETLAYAPPITDGDCLYLRGERYLYCIGAK
jgi:outer membrane protein assembly factor BamB